MKRFLVVLTIALFGHGGAFAGVEPDALKSYIGKPLNAVAATANAALRTITADVTRFEQVTLVCALSRNAGTAITLTISESVDGLTYGALHTLAAESGTVTIRAATITTPTISADYNFALPLSVVSVKSLKIVVAITTGGATDLITCGLMGGSN